MRNKLLSLFLLLLTSATVLAQKNKVETSDILNYWVAFDSVTATKDYHKQIDLINRLYIKKGTPGLAAFMEARGYTDSVWVHNINAYPKFWASIRSATLEAKESARELQVQIEKFKKLYPGLKPANIYFAIGGLNTGGTTLKDKVLIGTEIVTGSPTTDVSEFQGNWLKSVFANHGSNLVFLNLHEYVHTQQNGVTQNVLGQALREGICDFVAETVLGKPISTSYLTFGRAHADSVKQAFKREMFGGAYGHWFYNGSRVGEKADMGYYVGYEIAKGYYNQSKNKKAAIQELIELDYSQAGLTEKILSRSGYFAEGFDKEALIKNYKNNQPYVTGITPFENNAQDVDPGLKEIRITFSKPMTKDVSIDFPELGKDHFPLVKIIGYENDGKTLVLALKLTADKEYGFKLSNRSFQSADGYVFRDEYFDVNFKTKK